MELLRRLYEILNSADFSILGNIYLGPGNFRKIGGFSYFLVMAAGAAWLAAASWIVWRACRASFETGRREPDRKARKRIFFCATAFFLSWGAYVTFVYPPTTDEPHYLTIAESLAADGDIRLAGNYAARDFMKFYPAWDIDPHTVIIPGGEMYSQHTAGLPLLVLPGYAAAGRWGVLLTLAVMSGALIAALFALCRIYGSNRSTAFLCCAGISVSAPAVFGATLVFTEIPAALLLSLGLLSCGPGLAPAACAAALPWLHPRYALLSLGLAAACWAGSASSRREMIRNWLLLGAASAGLFLALYRGPALTASLNVLTERYPARIEDLTASSLAKVSFGNPLAASAAKFLDRDFGVLPFAPWLIVLIPGLIRPGKYRLLLPLSVGGAYFLITCLFRNWGGSAYPGRTLLPILPLAAPYLAQGLGWALSQPLRAAIIKALILISWAISMVLTACPVLRYTSGREWITEKMGWKANLLLPSGWFPSFADSPQWGLMAGLAALGFVIWAVLSAKVRK